MSTTSRRQALGLLGTAAVAGPLLAACGSKGKASAAPTNPKVVTAGTAGTADPDTIMVIRHAEKPTGTGAPFGITQDGQQDGGSLIVRGWTRAGALVELFDPAPGLPVRTGLLRPGAVYAATPQATTEQRPSETVTPVSTRLGVPLNTKFAKGDEKALATELIGLHGATLVSWEHENIPAIVAGLGPVTPTPPAQWPDARFDVVWVFTRTSGGWAFSQVPQLLLDGDLDQPIS